MRDRHVVTAYINRKPYIESQMTPSHLTLRDLERSKSRSLRFRSLISRKGAELGHMLLLNINLNLTRKAYGEYIDQISILIDKVNVKVTQILKA